MLCLGRRSRPRFPLLLLRGHDPHARPSSRCVPVFPALPRPLSLCRDADRLWWSLGSPRGLPVCWPRAIPLGWLRRPAALLTLIRPILFVLPVFLFVLLLFCARWVSGKSKLQLALSRHGPHR